MTDRHWAAPISGSCDAAAAWIRAEIDAGHGASALQDFLQTLGNTPVIAADSSRYRGVG